MTLILHGKAASNERVRAAVKAIRNDGSDVDVHVTWEAGDAARFTREAIVKSRGGGVGGVDRIVAGGGDGTVNEVFGAAFQEGSFGHCSFGILPLGTANDFAHSTAIPTDDPTAALRLIVSTPPRRMDVGLLNGAPFINLVSGGFGSRVTAQTDPELKRHLGGLAYLLSGLGRLSEWKPSYGRFSTPDFEWEGRFLAFALGNGRQAGGGIPLCPAALLDDGLIDLMIMPEISRDVARQAIRDLVHEGSDSLEKLAIHTRSRTILFEAEHSVSVNLDGEPGDLLHGRVECRARVLPVHVGSQMLFGAASGED